MADALRHRGQDGWTAVRDQAIVLGHVLKKSDRSRNHSPQPFHHRASGCMATGDVRLDNRRSLSELLGIDQSAPTTDVELVMRAYLRWGDGCMQRLVGDFAFAIWDPRSQQLFAARDQMGSRQIAYRHARSRAAIVATDPVAVAAFPRLPRRLNEARLLDALTTELEGVDLQSTFYDGVHRLPPAHAMTISAAGVTTWRYWRLTEFEQPRPGSTYEHVEEFSALFDAAVRARLQGDHVAAMLSGGLDSGCVAAAAADICRADDRPLTTVSAVSTQGVQDRETRLLTASAQRLGSRTVFVDESWLAEQEGVLDRLLATADEPFDLAPMLWSVYGAAGLNGFNVVLDGGSGDITTSVGANVSRMLLEGRFLAAAREIRGRARFIDEPQLAPTILRNAVFGALPPAVRTKIRPRSREAPQLRAPLVNQGAAQRLHLADRYEHFERWNPSVPARSIALDRRKSREHPFAFVGGERYDRVAARCGVEARDPFRDLHVVEFCASLPDASLALDGWPKILLRRTLAGRLPDEVVWRRGRDHVGAQFGAAAQHILIDRVRDALACVRPIVTEYVDPQVLSRLQTCLAHEPANRQLEDLGPVVNLVLWLAHHSE